MHIPPEVWGPIFWCTLHLVSLSYPEQPTYAEKRAAKEFYSALAYVLPCPVCRAHIAEILKGLPVDTWLDDRASLVEWVWTIHNRVNVRLGKPEISREEFHRRYKQMADRGLPIPPAPQNAEVADATVDAAWIRGAATATGVIAAAAVVGGLLWVSYKGK